MISTTHLVPGLCPSAGGPSRSVVQLCTALADIDNLRVSLLSQSLSIKIDSVQIPSKFQTLIGATSSSASLALGIPFRKLLLDSLLIVKPDILHSHGIWHSCNHWCSYISRSNKIPLIIQPHGMLEPWALSYRSLKKRFAMKLYQKRDLDSASLYIATSEQEAQSIRKFGIKQPIAIIPNGVPQNFPSKITRLKKSNSDFRTLLFLSRIHPKKGLINLIEAWTILKPKNWRLVIAGPDENDHLAEVFAAARLNKVENTIEYIGEIDDFFKSDIYFNSDIFVLPTFSENFGIVVAEALAHGLPVITTRGAPWHDLELFRCGWWIDIGVDPLVSALREAMSLTDSERIAMGIRGRTYVKRYNWNTIALQTAHVYGWMLGNRSKPDYVRLD